MQIASGSLLASAISLVFYLIMAVFVLASMITLYSLIKYGKAKLVVLFVSSAYLFAVLALLSLALGEFSKLIS